MPGQDILIPSRAVALAALDIPDPAIEKYASGIRGVKTHVVKPGETVGGIARKYGTTTERIMKLNGMKKSMIFPGQSLIVASSGPTTKASAQKHSAKAAPKKRPSRG